MRELVFISSPYSHENPEIVLENYKRVSIFVSELNSKGIHAMSPITYGHTLISFKDMPGDWDFWREFCLTFLERSTRMIVYMMPGWNKSRGVAEEIRFAIERNIPIEYVEFNQ